MKHLNISKTSCTPEVHLDPKNGVLFFSGSFKPMEGYSYYTPIIDWIKDYARNAHTTTTVKIHVESISTSSANFLVAIFRILKGLHSHRRGVQLEWFYDDINEISDWKYLLGYCNFPVEYHKVEKALVY